MFGKILLFVFIIALVIVILSESVFVIKQNNVGLITTWGQYKRKVEPGLHFLVPIAQKLYVVSKAQIPLPLDEQALITKDNASVLAKLSIIYYITDEEKYVFENQDSVQSVIAQTRSELRDIIGSKDLNEVLNQTSSMNTLIQNRLDSSTSSYGIKVARINIDRISPSKEIQRSMDKQVQASRESEAIQLKAEGESKAIEREAQANLVKAEKAADAQAYQLTTVADAKAQQIETINKALGSASDNYMLDRKISAIDDIIKSDANTVILPTDMTDTLKNVPAVTKIVEASETK